MNSPLSSAAQMDTVLAAVRRADLRRRRRSARREVLAAMTAGLAVLALVALARLATPVPAAVWWLAAAFGLGGLIVAGVRTWTRTPDLLAAAAALDRSADLNDTLLTAVWFADRSTVTSAWVDAQRERAATVAAALDVDALCPIAAPRRLRHAAGGLVVLLVACLLVPASWSRNVLGLAGASAGELAAGSSADAEEDRAPGGQGALDAPMSTEELLAAAEQGLRSGGTPDLEAGSAEAGTRAGSSSAAADGSAPDGEVSDVTASGPPAADAARGELGEGARAEGGAGESLQDALERAAEETRQASSEAAAIEAREEGAQDVEADGGDSDTGSGAGGAGQGSAAGLTEDEVAGAAAGGHLSGPGGDAADTAVLDAAQVELEITLKREQLSSQFLAPSASAEDKLDERQSEIGRSQLTYQNVAPAARYQGTGAGTVRPVPWAYQELVRQYFLARARQERKDPQ